MNFGAYFQGRVVFTYAVSRDLVPAELAAFELAKNAPDGDVLDIRVGTGRPTSHLYPRARAYIAIDFSAAKVGECRAQHPDIEESVGDARDQRRLADGKFEFVLFSCNGIHHVEPSERLDVLVGIRPIQRLFGVFVNSPHDSLVLGGRRPHLYVQRPTLTLMPFAMDWRSGRCPLRNARRKCNRKRLGASRLRGANSTRMNDSWGADAFLPGYHSRKHEEASVAKARFAVVRALDAFGNDVRAGGAGPWLYYVAGASP
jgi:SAM-dependent methyltransferase